MPSQSQVQALLDIRSKLYGEEFTKLSAEGLASWHVQTTKFSDIALDEYNMDRSKALSFFNKTLPMIKHMRIIEEKTTGSAEFCAWEMLLEVTNNVEMPEMNIPAGQKTMVRGVAVQQWAWSGPEEWDGDLSMAQLQNWKIVREHDYMITLKPSCEGETARMF